MQKYCPHCRVEYLESATICNDCKVALVKYEDVPPRCPSCKETFSFQESYCEKCLVDLDIFQKEEKESIEKKMPASPSEFIETVTIYETSDLAELSLIKALFESEHIHYNARGEYLQNLFGAGLLGGFNQITGAIKIDVSKDDVEKATMTLRNGGIGK
jgi:hypothetical protein